MELDGLVERVLAGGGIHHQQDFMRRVGVVLLHHALDFAQLVHQVVLRVQTACGIGNY